MKWTPGGFQSLPFLNPSFCPLCVCSVMDDLLFMSELWPQTVPVSPQLPKPDSGRLSRLMDCSEAEVKNMHTHEYTKAVSWRDSADVWSPPPQCWVNCFQSCKGGRLSKHRGEGLCVFVYVCLSVHLLCHHCYKLNQTNSRTLSEKFNLTNVALRWRLQEHQF